MVDHAGTLGALARGTVHAPLIYVGGKMMSTRLLLEPLNPAHAPLMYEGFADPALYRWVDV